MSGRKDVQWRVINTSFTPSFHSISISCLLFSCSVYVHCVEVHFRGAYTLLKAFSLWQMMTIEMQEWLMPDAKHDHEC